MNIVIAKTVDRARTIVRELPVSDAYATSVRSIKHYSSCRGLATVDKIIVDDPIWPLDDDVLEELMPFFVIQPQPAEIHRVVQL